MCGTRWGSIYRVIPAKEVEVAHESKKAADTPRGVAVERADGQRGFGLVIPDPMKAALGRWCDRNTQNKEKGDGVSRSAVLTIRREKEIS